MREHLANGWDYLKILDPKLLNSVEQFAGHELRTHSPDLRKNIVNAEFLKHSRK